MPALEAPIVGIIPAITLRVQASLDAREELMMELDGQMLYYLKHAMRASLTDRMRQPKRHDGARWRSDRKSWTARRMQPGQEPGQPEKTVWKSFNFADPDGPLAVEDAASMAVAWAEGRDDIDGCEVEPIQGGEPCDAIDESLQDDQSASSAAALVGSTSDSPGAALDASMSG